MPPKIRVFVVDDEPLVRRGLELFIRVQPDLEVCGVAEGVTDAAALIPKLHPDLAVIDVTLRDGSGLELTRALRDICPGVRVLIFSMHDQPSFVEAAFKAGAHGYICKDEGAENVIQAIRLLVKGEVYLTEAMSARLPLAWRQHWCNADPQRTRP